MKKNLILKTLILTLSLSLFSPLTMASYATDTKKTESSTQGLPNINAQSAITIDLETGEVIYCKDADSKRYPASTTKLLTSLLFAENKQKNDEIEYTKSAKEQPEYSLNINYMHNTMQVGDKMLADDVMKGLLLFSANDTAYMIADNVAGNSQSFADLMNKKAKELGANNSHFITANGLHDDNHYTTAYDLSLIAKAAFANPWVRETMELKTAPIDIKNSKIILENRNLTLGKNGNIAGKTGTTNAAGGCLATVYDRDGRQLIGVVLKSKQVDNADMTKFNDMDSIMDYSFAATKQTYKSKGNEVGTTDLQYKPFGFFGPTKTITVPLKLTQDVSYYPNSINDAESQITYNQANNASAWKLLFNKNTKLTYSTRNHSEEVTGTVDISLGSIIKDNILIYISTLVVIGIVGTLIVLIRNMISNSRNRRSRYRRRRY
ncbi:D-alanyl-D-alanine carboxypeptidase family protein [Clostridium saccharobutylicum]|uniref:Serine-type D-Ala-D-Ala carboxypeptidase n=1 Tax=Clostridium saccharobutylicum DSM 13864 TaxID=1345695 RepID=U5MNN5_CLOSA|nr:D-alanyl-D-alanine carboxypeptidase [Clostridium saccharobutylicum]AGX42210.1 serine-type D-Ala-D-Ala carboxypeptidase [Clostridium saccharobutylicum DSM 13864]AQR89490.1 D-alanyl-D-alanine carboxypeptidase DacB precursor [Clostridium saccharobutylicum]AQR99392.1 D-alanyl-D-alanine carboxypeptidase DacB precursor [Clostridium saccharobutylicum]AQS09123.1 D-alanyl-D-alanine carboxypeptidase DacB precursor [Clostridium saccharobutylicum]AQS13378.1 D-alanyl-D-alanine carboxypeptidase DacB prec